MLTTYEYLKDSLHLNIYIYPMNYLAHIFLSQDDQEVMLGNFMADMIRKKDIDHLSDLMIKGIKLHHTIDHFTDHHPIVRHSRSLFFDEFRHYSRVIIDVLYDHYLAKNWSYYHDKSLSLYVEEFYQYANDQKRNLPYRVRKVIPIMIEYNWLYNYSTINGIIKILKQMSRRIDDGTRMDKCLPVFKEHYQLLEKDFTAFFHDLQLEVSRMG